MSTQGEARDTGNSSSVELNGSEKEEMRQVRQKNGPCSRHAETKRDHSFARDAHNALEKEFDA
jgi:hypothetical protein